MSESIINGIDVSESISSATNDNIVYSQKVVDELQNTIKRLQEENEKIKKQYNCYACGNCNGKEDYINLEKHHIGLRKQFDELVKRNNTLSLRIEELEKENEKLKKRCEELDKMTGIFSVRLANKYKQALEEIRALLTSKLQQMKSIDTRSIWFVRLTGEIDMLKWVLEDSEDVENN